MRFEGDTGERVEGEDRQHHVVEVAQEPLGGNGGRGVAGGRGEPGDELGEAGAHGGPAGPRAGSGECGDADGVVARTEGVVAQQGVESGHGGSVRGVHGDPGGVADDVEGGVGRLPLLGEAGAEQPVHLDAAVEFLAEVLAAGVGDAQAQGELEHRGRARAVDGANGGGGVPGLAVRAQVVQKSRVMEGGDGGALEQVAGLPGVQGKGGGAVGQREPGGESAEELWGGHGAAALGPGRFAREGRGFDREPVQGEGTVEFG